MNTTRLFWCQGCVQRDVLSANHKTESPALFVLLKQTIEAHKRATELSRVTNIQKEKAEKDESE